MQVGQMVYQVRPGRGDQGTKAEQHAKGDQTIGDAYALTHSSAHWGSRTHRDSQPMHS